MAFKVFKVKYRVDESALYMGDEVTIEKVERHHTVKGMFLLALRMPNGSLKNVEDWQVELMRGGEDGYGNYA